MNRNLGIPNPLFLCLAALASSAVGAVEEVESSPPSLLYEDNKSIIAYYLSITVFGLVMNAAAAI